MRTKCSPPQVLVAAGLFLVIAAGLSAQSTTQPRPLDEGEPVQLSPFNVVTDRDTGFVAASSLAGGRLATDLKDTPLAYSVITRELLDALNLFDVEDAMTWSVGSYIPYTDVTNYRYFNNESGSSIISRGIQTARPQRNFFQLGLNSDTYSQERIDFARGPNALLIGTTGLGGSVITMTKRARTDKSFSRLSLVAGSWGRQRASLDYNLAVDDRFGLRINLLEHHNDTWRDLEFEKRSGIHLAVVFRPGPRTAIRFEHEHYNNELLAGRESMEDRISGWDGVSIVAAPIGTIANSDTRGIARLGSTTSSYLVMIPGQDTGVVTNFANTWTTMGGGASANVRVAGVLPLSTANLGVNGGNLIGDVYDPLQRLSLALTGAQGNLRVPGRHTVTGPTSPGLVYQFDDTAIYLEHQQGNHLFLEAGAHRARTSKLSQYIMAREANEIFLDVNQTLPTGGPNPNFLRPYFDSFNSHQHFDNDYDEARAAAGLVFDNTRWGDFRGNLIVGRSLIESRTYRRTLVMNRDPDIRRRSANDVFRFRYYFDNPAPLPEPASVRLVDPVTGTTQSYGVESVIDLNSTTNNRGFDTEYDYAQAALNAKLWKGRINLLAGMRRDSYHQQDRSLSGSAQALFNDYPSNWDGQTLIFRPPAPGDYWDLTYIPKDANGNPTGAALPALSRPRLSGVPLAQYRNDRFRDDFSAPAVDFSIDTLTYGGVFHVREWISAYANYAETYVPPGSGLTLTGAPIPAGIGDGWDAGLRFYLFGGSIVASVGRYSGNQSNNSFDSSGSTRKYADIVAANVIGDLSATGMNNRGLSLIPTPTFDFQDRRAAGYELDVVANITRNWRLTFNYSDPEVYTTNTRQDEWSYLLANESTLRQIVIDAGGLIDAGNVATVNTTIPVGNRSPDVSAAVTGWNNIQTFKATNDPTIRTFSNLPAFTSNLYTDYRFSSGWLKNLRVGAGVQVFGKRSIGNRGADTIVNPANPAAAIDDPNVDINTRIYAPAYYTATATVGYERKLTKSVGLSLNLSVRNLLADDDLIYTGTSLRPPNGDISRPDRVSTPVGFRYNTPRSYTLTASLTF